MKQLFTSLFTLIGLFTLAQPAGSLDPSFGTDGKVITSITTGLDKAYGVALQSDGKILVAGHSSSTITGKDFVCIRYNEDGSLDTDFGTAGIVTTDLQLGSDDVAFCIALQADGKIVLGGYSDNGSNKDAALVRYESTGEIDTNFGVNGIVLTNFENSQQDEIKVIKIHQLTGNIIVGGSSIISSSVSKPVVARYLSNGDLDTDFNTTGIKLLWITNLDYQYLFSVEDLIVQPNGKITATGWRDFPGLSWSSDYWVGKINSDGTMDPTFSTDGVNVYNGGFNGHDRAYSMILKENGNILFSGGGYVADLKYDFTIQEITSSGTTAGWSASVNYGALINSIAYGMGEDNSGRFVLAGSSGSTTAKSFALTRITSTSEIDNTFGTSGKVTTTFESNQLNECFDMVIQSDNKIVAVGYTGNDFAIARYLGENTPDLEGFTLTSPINNTINQNYASLAFNWTDAFGATGYELQIDTDINFVNSPQTYYANTSAKTLTDLLPNTQYFWRVHASAGIEYGDYSTTWSFTTNSLENFNLITPTDNATNQDFASLILDWSNAIGAAEYQLQIATDIDFTENLQSVNQNNSTYTILNLDPETQYYWRVRASNDGVNFGEWTSVWNFTTSQNSATFNAEYALTIIKTYPNPVTEILVIEAGENSINQNYSICDLNGKILASGVIKNKISSIAFEVFPAGNYLIRVGKETPISIIKH